MDHVTLGSGTFQDISDVLAFTKFKMCIFLTESFFMVEPP